MHSAAQLAISYAAFREPDLNDALTAVAFEPSQRSRTFLRKIPLLLSELKPQKINPAQQLPNKEKILADRASNTLNNE